MNKLLLGEIAFTAHVIPRTAFLNRVCQSVCLSHSCPSCLNHSMHLDPGPVTRCVRMGEAEIWPKHGIADFSQTVSPILPPGQYKRTCSVDLPQQFRFLPNNFGPLALLLLLLLLQCSWSRLGHLCQRVNCYVLLGACRHIPMNICTMFCTRLASLSMILLEGNHSSQVPPPRQCYSLGGVTIFALPAVSVMPP